MKTILGISVSVIVALTLFAPSTGNITDLNVKNLMESYGTAKLKMEDARLDPTSEKPEAVIEACLGGNGKTGALTIYIEQRLRQRLNLPTYKRVVLIIPRERLPDEPEIPSDRNKSREQKREEFKSLLKDLQSVLPEGGLELIEQDVTTQLTDVVKKLNPSKTAVNVEAKVGSGKSTDNIQPKLTMGLMIDAYLAGAGVPSLANDVSSGLGAKNAHEMLIEPTSVISAHRVDPKQRPCGLVLFRKTDNTEQETQKQEIQGQIKASENNIPAQKGAKIRVAYASIKDNKSEADVIQALALDKGIPSTWSAAFDLIHVEVEDFPLPQ